VNESQNFLIYFKKKENVKKKVCYRIKGDGNQRDRKAGKDCGQYVVSICFA
jgi:hypothetical protein